MITTPGWMRSAGRTPELSADQLTRFYNMHYQPDINVIVLIGQTIVKIEQIDGDMVVTNADGKIYRFYHDYECCESVCIHDIKGDIESLIGSPILGVVETIKSGGEGDHEGWPSDVDRSIVCESWTWTTFDFTTAKGAVAIRWLGESNGYYGESVSFQEVE